MKKILVSKAVTRVLAIILSIAMVITLMPVSQYVKADGTTVLSGDTSMEDVALQATASANAERSEWGIVASNLNNGHNPSSSGNPEGSWHDYGIESTDGTSWVQYDWTKDVIIDSMSIYWMNDGEWAKRIPKSAKVEYKDATGAWQPVATYDATVMAAQVADQYNTLMLEKEITTKCIRITMVRNEEGFCSIHRWQVWGNVAPVDVAPRATATASAEVAANGYVAANLNSTHVPISSADEFSWCDYGSVGDTSWVQYDWDVDVTVDSMSVYWQNDGTANWLDRLPSSATVEYKDGSGNWVIAITGSAIAVSGSAIVMSEQKADQYNNIAFNQKITTKSIRMTMVKNTAADPQFCSINRWMVWGQIPDAPEDPLTDEAVVKEITDGYKMSNKYFAVETGKYGQLTSIKIQGDKFPTNYIMNEKTAASQKTAGHQWVGELMFNVKVGDATAYTEENTNKSDTGRTITLDGNKIVVTYENATGNKAIKDFKVVETYSIVGDKLKWDITVTNTNTDKLIIGDFGLPLAFNEYWSGGGEIYESKTIDHSFVGKESSYIYVTRPSGAGQYLLMTPDTSTGAGFEYQDHWRTQERAADEVAWCQDQAGWANGLNVFYIHSDYIKKTNRGYLDNSTLELAAGESKTYSFDFSAVNDEADMKTTLYEEGIIDAVAVPGMTYARNMPGKLYLHTTVSGSAISFDIQCPHENGLHAGNANTVSNNITGCLKTNENTYVKFVETVMVDGEQYHVYDIKFADLGQNNVIIKYNGGASSTVLQFYMMDDVATALETHSDFMVDQTQWDTPLKTGDKVFDDWMMDTKNKRGATDTAYWLKNYWGWGDDWGLTHGEYIAEKNVYQPVAKEITAVDEYLDIAVWNGLMREHQKDYKIHDFLMEAINTSPTYRGYAYPHIYNTYFSMYKIASKYPDMIEYKEDANTYLLRTYHILKALYGEGVSYNYSTGLMGELTTPDIIAALIKEGYYTEAQTIVDIMAEKYANFKNTTYPYGSEYAYDNTGEEAVYTLAKLNNATDTANSNIMMGKIDLKTRACRGLQPLWYQYANPTTNCGENWWNFQYTASLAGYCMDDWLRLQDNKLTETQSATASRVNYAAKLANLTCINSGQIDSDPANIGAIAWTYQSEMGNLGGQGTGEGDLHNGWRQMAGEADLGLFGALQILSSDVTIDPVFGLFGYGCNVTEASGIYTVTPLDGLFTRLNFINQKLYIELNRDQYTQAKVTKDNTSIVLSMKNLEGTVHDSDIEVTGLNAGSYQVFVNGTVAGSFQAIAGKASIVTVTLPAAATAEVSILAGTALANEAPEVTLATSKTVVISAAARLEADATDDGYVNSTLAYTWEVVSTPVGGAATLANPEKHITDVTFSKVGVYEFKFTANDGERSTSKNIIVTVGNDPTLPEIIVNYTFNEGTVSGTRKLVASSETRSDVAELDNKSVLVDAKEGKGVKYTGAITGGYVELPETLTKNLVKATISIDVKLSGNLADKTTLFELGNNVVVEFAAGNELTMTVNKKTVSANVAFATGYWKNIELTADGDDYTLYVEGVKKAEFLDTKLILADIDTNTERYLIGRSNTEADPFLNGVVDNVIVKSVVMTAAQLKATYGIEGEATIVSGKAGSMVTSVGTAPVLPATIKALYSDGVYLNSAVTWNAVKASDYEKTGKFIVNGKITGTDIVISISVIVVSGTPINVAGAATPSAIVDSPQDLGGVKGLNDGFEPADSGDTSNGAWHNWLGGNQGGAAWVQYNWNTEQIITSMDAYFFKDGGGNFAPASYKVEYLNEEGAWYTVTNAVGLGVLTNQYNTTSFDPIATKAIRMTLTPAANGSGVIEWKVYAYPSSVVVLDKAALNAAITKAEALNSSLYSAGIEAVKSALAKAKTVTTDANSTQEAIDAATSALNSAIGSLTLKVTGQTGVPAATPTPIPTQTVEKVKEGDNSVSSSLSIAKKDKEIEVTVKMDLKEVISRLEKVTSSDGEVIIPITSQSLIDQMKKDKVSEVNIVVDMSSELLANRNIEHANLNLKAELLEAAGEAGIDVNVSVKNETGKEMYSWTFNGRDLADTDKKISDVNLSLSVEKATDQTDLGDILSKKGNLENGLIIRFSHEGVLPAQASVKIYVGNLVDNRDNSIYLYHYNSNTGKLETLPYSSNYKIDSEGYITISLLHCSEYVILTKPADKKNITSLVKQIKVTPKNKTLYVGGTKNFETSIEVMIPATLEIVSSLSSETSSNAVGAVAVNYKSSNDKIATVDSKGKITAVGVGKASIITTVKLYSNKSITAKTEIVVKEPYIKFKSSKATMKVGDRFTFIVNAYGLDLNSIVWKTTEKSILTIDNSGKATAKSKGTDYVKVQIDGIVKTVKVVVK